MSDPRADLQRELKADLPPAIAGLPDKQVAKLAVLVGDSRHRQQAALAKALDDGLSFVPRLLRGPVKKALGL
jgi:hypothetical protein